MSIPTSRLAGRGERILARLIDELCIYPFLAIILNFSQLDNGLQILATFLVSLAYHVGFVGSSWQATPGKRLLSIYIAHTDGRPLSHRDALQRFLGWMLPFLPVYSSLFSEQIAMILVLWLALFWFMPIFTTPLRMGLHDRLCHTLVMVGKVNKK